MCKFQVFAGTPQTMFFRVIWQMVGHSCVQNTPMGVGRICPHIREIAFPPNKCVMPLPIDCYMRSPICHCPVCFEQRSTGNMTVPTLGSFHCFGDTMTPDASSN